MQHCFTVMLQKGFVDYETLTDFPSAWGWVDNEWMLMFGWTNSSMKFNSWTWMLTKQYNFQRKVLMLFFFFQNLILIIFFCCDVCLSCLQDFRTIFINYLKVKVQHLMLHTTTYQWCTMAKAPFQKTLETQLSLSCPNIKTKLASDWKWALLMCTS